MDCRFVSTAYLYALSSAVFFALASVGFAHYARRSSPQWMNAFKAAVAFICFGISYFFVKDFSRSPSVTSLFAFFLSGLVGLNIADYFLMRAFTRIGSARTLIIFSFQPIMMGLFAFFIFGQEMDLRKILAIVLMMACVFTMSYEKFRQEGAWELKGPIFAFLGVVLDSFGILLTRFAFDTDQAIGVMEGNFYRTIGAVTGFWIMSMVKPFRLVSTYKAMKKKSRWIVLGAAVGGTFVSLSLYLNAVRTGHLAGVTAIVGAGPIFAAIIESIISRRLPSLFLLIALGFFAIGFGLLL